MTADQDHVAPTWDAFYVALAEAFDAPLLTLGRTSASAAGAICQVEVIGD